MQCSCVKDGMQKRGGGEEKEKKKEEKRERRQGKPYSDLELWFGRVIDCYFQHEWGTMATIIGASNCHRRRHQKSQKDKEDNNSGTTIAASLLLTPKVISAEQVTDMIQKVRIKGNAPITGSGFTGNILCILDDGLAAKIDLTSWEAPRVSRWIQQTG
ncbi:hypothetical protein CBR_g46846 [Chara braunii]|uniref:Uncharacterized protein n=1 Tax=Chara braunii TaxID=69332 RepID=A0A388M137_CHABU|nr:hypothetical protein CBR_g46846 [Chara braunii]|eukprot:GBG88280.1 hypothetical protein CBR_g46846 [Chara braunii]